MSGEEIRRGRKKCPVQIRAQEMRYIKQERKKCAMSNKSARNALCQIRAQEMRYTNKAAQEVRYIKMVSAIQRYISYSSAAMCYGKRK